MTLKRILKNINDFKAGKLLITPMLDRWLSEVGNLVLTEEEALLYQKLMMAQQRDRTKSFSSSSLGSCPRRQMFQYIGLPRSGSVDSVGTLRMMDGTNKHLLIQFIGLHAGFLTHIEVPIRVPKLNLKGSLDGDHDSDWGWELKTTQAFGYFVSKGPSMSHLKQIHGYFIGRPDLERFSLMYMDTRTCDWKEFVIWRDQSLLTVMKSELEKLNTQATYNLLPEVLEECRNGKGDTFNRCPYSSRCLTITDWEEAVALNPQVSSDVQRDNPGDAKGTRRVLRRPAGKKRTT